MYMYSFAMLSSCIYNALRKKCWMLVRKMLTRQSKLALTRRFHASH